MDLDYDLFCYDLFCYDLHKVRIVLLDPPLRLFALLALTLRPLVNLDAPRVPSVNFISYS
jgi:hypothetical protein